MALGFALSSTYTCPKPDEFGSTGANWSQIGWRVDVSFQILKNPIEPRAHIKLLAPLLPKKYSPIQPSGDGNQIYLAEISREFGRALLSLLGDQAQPFIAQRAVIVLNPEDWRVGRAPNEEMLRQWDSAQIEKIEKDHALTETEKKQVIISRRGQGEFRKRVSRIETCCRITHVQERAHLVASHIKPWRVSDNKERLDGENGLLLTPSIDHLFDNGYISFRNNGVLLVSSTAHRAALIKMGVPRSQEYNVGTFTRTQAQYLEYHRDSIFLKARG